MIEQRLKINSEQTCKNLENFISKKVQEYGRSGVILGLSGGLDSAVVAALAVRSVGTERILALIMPERDSAPGMVADAKLVAQHYGIQTKTIHLTSKLRKVGIYKLVPRSFLIPRRIQERYVRKKEQQINQRLGIPSFLATLQGTSDKELNKAIAYFRCKHRLRMLILYLQAEQKNLLVVGTSNKTEWLTGLFVPWGDGAADIMPLLMLYKTQVRQLAQYLDVPLRIIQKVPSPDLFPGLNDEQILRLSYEKLDAILFLLEQGLSVEEITQITAVSSEQVRYVKQLISSSEHLRCLPETIQQKK